jgi:hypothetical protein
MQLPMVFWYGPVPMLVPGCWMLMLPERPELDVNAALDADAPGETRAGCWTLLAAGYPIALWWLVG